MRTKEDVFQNKCGFGLIGNNQTISLPKELVLDTMQEYADEQSVQFAEWLDKIILEQKGDRYFNIVKYDDLDRPVFVRKSKSELLTIFKEQNGK